MKLAFPRLRRNWSRSMCSSRSICVVSTVLLALVCSSPNAQTVSKPAQTPPEGPPLSEPATASATVAGGTIDIRYNTPHMRGRKIMGGLVPFGQVWRTGANPATTLISSVPLRFGDLLVRAGTHTIYSLPSADTWQLIINNQTGQWGLTYDQSRDLGRVPMKAKPMSTPQEIMSISFEHTTPKSTELHIRWETTDRYVTITAP
jgi:hypothetical protein